MKINGRRSRRLGSWLQPAEEMTLWYSSLFHYTRTHTRGPVHMCNHTMSTHGHTTSLHYWLPQKEIAIGPRQGFNWSQSQFNARRGLTVIVGKKRGRGEGFGEEILQPVTLKPAALDDRNSVTWPTKMRPGCWESTDGDLGSSEMGDIKLNLIPISLWSLWPDLGYF